MPIGTTVYATPCPECRRELVPLDPGRIRCPACGQPLRASLGYLVRVPDDETRVS